jgi:hypothetical protein
MGDGRDGGVEELTREIVAELYEEVGLPQVVV